MRLLRRGRRRGCRYRWHEEYATRRERYQSRKTRRRGFGETEKLKAGDRDWHKRFNLPISTQILPSLSLQERFHTTREGKNRTSPVPSCHKENWTGKRNQTTQSSSQKEKKRVIFDNKESGFWLIFLTTTFLKFPFLSNSRFGLVQSGI